MYHMYLKGVGDEPLQGCGCRRRDELGGNGALVVTAVDVEHIFRQTQETQMIHIYYHILLYIKMMNYLYESDTYFIKRCLSI